MLEILLSEPRRHDAGAPLFLAAKDRARRTEVWLCGPQGLSEKLRKGLDAAWPGNLRFHQEAFEMR